MAKLKWTRVGKTDVWQSDSSHHIEARNTAVLGRRFFVYRDGGSHFASCGDLHRAKSMAQEDHELQSKRRET